MLTRDPLLMFWAPADDAGTPPPVVEAPPVVVEAPAPILGGDPPVEAEKEPEAKEGAPEAYTDFTLPEGVVIPADDLTVLHEFSKENNFTQAQAQKAVERMTEIRARDAQKQTEAWAATVEGWADTTRTDKEIGGDKFDENVGVANAALKKFATPELIAALGQAGLHNHPEMVRFCMKVGRAMGEDAIVSGTTATAGERSHAEIMFGKSK